MKMMNPKFLTNEALLDMVAKYKDDPHHAGYADLCDAEIAKRMTVQPTPDSEFPDVSEFDARIIREHVVSFVRVLGDCGKYGLRELETEKAVTSMVQNGNMIDYNVTITYKASISASKPIVADAEPENTIVDYRVSRSWETGESHFTPITDGEPVKFTR